MTKRAELKMPKLVAEANALIERGDPAIVASVAEASGSTPRDKGAWMVVTPSEIIGTIGGGQLEWLVTSRARTLLESGDRGPVEEVVSLGPEINQCCGGRMLLRFEKLSAEVLGRMIERSTEGRYPVQIHGAGHTGRALARSLALLPVEAQLVDVRPGTLLNLPGNVATACLPVPEQAVRESLPRSAFVVLTHSHDLDFLIAAEALKRQDASYVGMIGSKTKRAVFARWLDENGYGRELADRLTCPIGALSGGGTVADKRPEVIAALVAAELMMLFASQR